MSSGENIFIVYKITNTINGRFYVGVHVTTNIYDDYMGSGKIITQAISKYGIENFQKEIIHIADNEESMFQKEREIVDEKFINRKDTYNLVLGGKGGWSYVNAMGLNGRGELPPWNKGKELPKLSEARKAKISATLKKRYETQEHNLKGVEAWNKGKKMGPAWNKGRKAETSPCPHCGREVNAGNMTRWHGDNCKELRY